MRWKRVPRTLRCAAATATLAALGVTGLVATTTAPAAAQEPDAGAPAAAQEADAGAPTLVLRPDRILDGRGGVLTGREVWVRDGRIVAVPAPAGEGTPGPGGSGTGRMEGTGGGFAAGERLGDPIVYELPDATLLPGLIDTHVHIGWHFDRETGRIHDDDSEPPEEAVLYGVENAWATLVSGVTTVQSVGAPADAFLRDAIAEGGVPGPRILTSLGPIGAGTGGPEELAEAVDGLADAGADLVKIFASASIRDGGTPTLTQEQLDAACGRARERGLRTMVHAHGSESARRAARAGCDQIAHGLLLDRATLERMGERGMYFDPQIHLVFQNYFDHRDRFLGVGNYTEEGFRRMREARPGALRVFREALTVDGLRVVFGTDAVAGAHGENRAELVRRVRDGGQDPMDAIVSATSLAAASLGLEERVGAVAPGLEADLIAVAGAPDRRIEDLGRVVLVVRGGTVYRYVPPPYAP